MVLRQILARAILAGCAIMPLTAHAGTRASALARPVATQSPMNNMAARKNVIIRKENGIAPIPLVFLIALGVGGTVVAADAIVDDNKSRGAS